MELDTPTIIQRNPAKLSSFQEYALKILVATANIHKVQEIRTILGDQGFEVLSLIDRPDLPEPGEDGETFAENALQKAREIHSHTGLPVFADDSGLEVDALNGAPGVHSKRFSQQATAAANNDLLLERLTGVEDRSARFRCVLALVTATFEGTVDGTCEGTIADSPIGTHGFGYDPLFLPDDLPGRTMAEASIHEKNAISHRGRAFRQLRDLLDRAKLAEN